MACVFVQAAKHEMKVEFFRKSVKMYPEFFTHFLIKKIFKDMNLVYNLMLFKMVVLVAS